MPYGRIPPRGNALCPQCLSLERHRLLWLYLKERTSFFNKPLRVLHVAPERCFLHRFEKLRNLDYITADLESPLARIKMDIHQIPFRDNSFDVILCNHVLEHVEDDIHAMKELYRVLKKGGWAIMQVPFMGKNLAETFEDPTIKDSVTREKKYGQRDHVRIYGKDFPQRLENAGFTVKQDQYVMHMGLDRIKKHALPSDEIIYYCSK